MKNLKEITRKDLTEICNGMYQCKTEEGKNIVICELGRKTGFVRCVYYSTDNKCWYRKEYGNKTNL